MSQASVAQINARLPRDLKAAGDEGLQALGLSPSDAVRALWTRLSQRGDDLESVRTFLLGEESNKEGAAVTFEQSELAQGWRMLNDRIAQLGLSAEAESVQWSSWEDNDHVAQALEERMQTRGLM